MAVKNYLLLARSNDGYIHQKVSINCDLHFAILACTMILKSSSRLTRGEIIEGDKTHIGDFSVKPIHFIYRDGDIVTDSPEKR